MMLRVGPSRWFVEPQERLIVITGVGGILALLAILGAALNALNYDVFSAILVGAFLLIASVPIMRRLAEHDQDPSLFNLLLLAFVLKLAGSMARYATIYFLYNKTGDAGLYDFGGWNLALQLRAGNFAPVIPSYIANRGPETERIVWITAFIYTFIGRSTYAAFFVYSTIAFWGCVLFTRAARLALPEIDHRRYEKLVLLLPSLLFWPSSIGKDAWMLGFLGITAYGAALLLKSPPRFTGAVPGILGVGGLAMIRPHVAAMAILALGAALSVSVVLGQRSPTEQRGRSFATKAVALVIVALVGLAVLNKVSGFFGNEGTAAALNQTLDQTSTGGSQFVPVRVLTGIEFIPALVSVFFRPLLFEARSPVMAFAALESTALIALLITEWRRLRTLPRLLLRRSYLVFCAAYTAMFVVGFSNIANFGILTRQRSQMLPLMLLLFALPKSLPDDGAAADTTRVPDFVPEYLRRRPLDTAPAPGSRPT